MYSRDKHWKLLPDMNKLAIFAKVIMHSIASCMEKDTF